MDGVGTSMVRNVFEELTFEEKLDRLASVAVRVGLNLSEGQEVMITASTEHLPLVRRLTEHAYKAGAMQVTTFYSDDESILSRYRYAPDASFDFVSKWMVDAMEGAWHDGVALISILGTNPALLVDQDQSKINRASIALAKAAGRTTELLTRHAINHTLIAGATRGWAKLVFPTLAEDAAVSELWDTIFRACRLDGIDPFHDWQLHCERIDERVQFLNAKRYRMLHFRGPGTDLQVGLADGHLWTGAKVKCGNGISAVINIPTEECFTTPHKDRVSGTVVTTKPLSFQGIVLDRIEARFENGSLVDAQAANIGSILPFLTSIDPGATRLGEVALTRQSSPIARSQLLFRNTLFDENAACHIALGQSFANCLVGGEKMDPPALAMSGANSSRVHIDWMIGSERVDVDGIDDFGACEPLMRNGEWVEQLASQQ